MASATGLFGRSLVNDCHNADAGYFSKDGTFRHHESAFTHAASCAVMRGLAARKTTDPSCWIGHGSGSMGNGNGKQKQQCLIGLQSLIYIWRMWASVSQDREGDGISYIVSYLAAACHDPFLELFDSNRARIPVSFCLRVLYFPIVF